MRKLIGVTLVACLALSAGTAHALSILASEATMFPAGYGGGSGYTYWTSAVNTASGNNVDMTANLENYAEMDQYDAILVNIRSYSYSLTETEIANLKTYIATGRRVLMIGENHQWRIWDRSLMEVVGGTFVDGVQLGGYATPAATSELLDGVDQLFLQGAGMAYGGESLFDKSFAHLWGDGNVLTVLDINLFANAYWGMEDNGVFATNVAKWLAASGVATPLPGAVWLLGSGLLGLVGIRWKRRS